jgi:spore cortex biosynthesis protein YabQ
MVTSANIQLYYFLITIAAGLIIGVLFDIYRIIRGFNNPGNFITAAADILFWLFAAILIFIYFLFTTNGELRYYTVVAVIIGLILYFKIISNSLVKSIRWSVYYILKLFRLLIMYLFYPVKLLIYLIGYIIYIIKSFFQNNLKVRLSFKKYIKKLHGFKINKKIKKEK